MAAPTLAVDEDRQRTAAPVGARILASARGGLRAEVEERGWTHHPDRFDEPDARQVNFTLSVQRGGKPLAGHNIQAHVAAPDKPHSRKEPSMTLASGWLVYFRNQFAAAPDVAERILRSADQELSAATAELDSARGRQMAEASTRLFAAAFRAHGPDYWP